MMFQGFERGEAGMEASEKCRGGNRSGALHRPSGKPHEESTRLFGEDPLGAHASPRQGTGLTGNQQALGPGRPDDGHLGAGQPLHSRFPLMFDRSNIGKAQLSKFYASGTPGTAITITAISKAAVVAAVNTLAWAMWSSSAPSPVVRALPLPSTPRALPPSAARGLPARRTSRRSATSRSVRPAITRTSACAPDRPLVPGAKEISREAPALISPCASAFSQGSFHRRQERSPSHSAEMGMT
jgi:hypothetical protein